jgi:hypothetical protein
MNPRVAKNCNCQENSALDKSILLALLMIANRTEADNLLYILLIFSFE